MNSYAVLELSTTFRGAGSRLCRDIEGSKFGERGFVQGQIAVVVTDITQVTKPRPTTDLPAVCVLLRTARFIITVG